MGTSVVGIHGIAQTYEGAPSIEAVWLPHLQSGLEEAGKPLLATTQFALVAYGSLFRPSGMRAGLIPALKDRDIEEGWERELLIEWWRAAAVLSEENRTARTADPLGEDSTIQPPNFEGRARTPAMVQRALRQLAKSRFFRGLGPERALIFGLKQVRRFLYDLPLKQAVLERVAAKVMPDTKVVIGHSLGAVVAYEALCAHPEWKVHTLVTLGAPLGIRNLVFDALTPRPHNGRGAWPNVEQWVNVADQGDIVALEKTLAPRFGRVVDVLVHNGWKSHDVARYLTSREVGLAIAAGLTGSP